MAEPSHGDAGQKRATPVVLGTTTAGGAGLLVGVMGANSQAANTIINALVKTIGALDPTVVLLAAIFFSTGLVCWQRTTQISDHIAKQYDALQQISAVLAVLADRRNRQEDITKERRND